MIPSKPNAKRDRGRFLNRIVFFLVAAGLSVFIVIQFLNGPGHLNGNYKANFISMVAGTAYKPYVNRALIPFITRSIVAVTPIQTQNALGSLAYHSRYLSGFLKGMGWEKDHVFEYIVVILLIYGATIGFAYALRALLVDMFEASRGFYRIVPFVAMLGLPVFFQFTYFYDLPQLFLFTLALSLMVERRWAAYLMVLFLAVLNKETSGLLILVFGIYYWNRQRKSRKTYWELNFAQILIFLLVMGGIGLVFKTNPGGATENYFKEHLNFLLQPYSLSVFLSLGLVCLGIFARWNQKPPFLKNAIWIGIPLLISFVPYGYKDEIRVFYELYPVVVCLIAQSVAEVMGVSVASKQPESSLV